VPPLKVKKKKAVCLKKNFERLKKGKTGNPKKSEIHTKNSFCLDCWPEIGKSLKSKQKCRKSKQ
jgi:hypothetical protein